MKIKELLKELIDCEREADVVFETDQIVYEIDYIQSNGSFRVSLKWDSAKRAL